MPKRRVSNLQRRDAVHRPVSFATLHGKDTLVRDLFFQGLGWRVVHAEVDTDSLGTFSGEIPRLLGPLDTARAKAERGISASGLSAGLASEGSIGPHPSIPFVTANIEFLVFIDHELGIEVSEHSLSTDIVAVFEDVNPESDIDELCRRAALPQHALIVRNAGDSVHFVRKGLQTPEEVRVAVADCLSEVGGERVRVESDFRAMYSPSRQRTILACAQKLITRMQTECPHCTAPGWGKVGYEYGLPCEACSIQNNSVPKAERWGCTKCEGVELVSLSRTSVDPSQCHWCNP